MDRFIFLGLIFLQLDLFCKSMIFRIIARIGKWFFFIHRRFFVMLRRIWKCDIWWRENVRRQSTTSQSFVQLSEWNLPNKEESFIDDVWTFGFSFDDGGVVTKVSFSDPLFFLRFPDEVEDSFKAGCSVVTIFGLWLIDGVLSPLNGVSGLESELPKDLLFLGWRDFFDPFPNSKPFFNVNELNGTKDDIGRVFSVNELVLKDLWLLGVCLKKRFRNSVVSVVKIFALSDISEKQGNWKKTHTAERSLAI